MYPPKISISFLIILVVISWGYFSPSGAPSTSYSAPVIFVLLSDWSVVTENLVISLYLPPFKAGAT